MQLSPFSSFKKDFFSALIPIGEYKIPLGLMLFAGLAAIVMLNPVLAKSSTDDPDWFYMAMNLFGGLALFLFGMDQMSDALKAVAGKRMKTILSRLTTNRFMGAITGAFVTAIIQSSSVTTVLVVGFISAGLMSMAQSIGVIMGANIGTTITAQIVAFKVTKYAMLMISLGFGMLFVSKQEKIKEYGAMLMGLGLIFFGMHIMSEAMHPLREYQPFLDLMIEMENPFYGILIAAAFTALVQSSSATTGIVIVMASQGFITLPAGIALAFGANIGTCITAGIASIGKPHEAVRAAVVHVLFNVFGVLLWLGFIPYLANFVTSLSPSADGLTGIDKLAQETPRQIANAHTIFNIANTLIFIGFTGVFARLVEWMVPDRALKDKPSIAAKYIDSSLISTPSLALDQARMEIVHMSETVLKMLHDIGPAFIAAESKQLNAIARLDDDVNYLHREIITYLSEVGQGSISSREYQELSALLSIANDLEEIGDIVSTDLTNMGLKFSNKELQMSKKTQDRLADIYTLVQKSVSLCMDALKNQSQGVARDVIALKRDIKQLTEKASNKLEGRLRANEPNRLELYTLEISLIEKLWRIYYFSKRMAKNVKTLRTGKQSFDD